jgi:hypothetical protein
MFSPGPNGSAAAVSVVVERGLARCPRCVAVADYTFVESGPNSLRYEVRCGRCGEDYCEVHTPVAPDFTAAGDALVALPPLVVPSAFALRRRRAEVWLTETWTATTSQLMRIVVKARAFRR